MYNISSCPQWRLTLEIAMYDQVDVCFMHQFTRWPHSSNLAGERSRRPIFPMCMTVVSELGAFTSILIGIAEQEQWRVSI